MPFPTDAKPSALVVLLLAVLVLLAYAPALSQPFIEDDYPLIVIAKSYGAVSGWPQMFANPAFRPRSTSLVFLNGLHAVFGTQAAGYYAAAILLQILNTWLVYALGVWHALGFRVTACAAGFFAVYEGHQEATMWISGTNESLLLFFGLVSVVCWIRFLEQRRAVWYAAAFLSFCLALLSKESAVALVPLLTLPVLLGRGARTPACRVDTRVDARSSIHELSLLLPFAALAAISALSLFASRSNSFRFDDGTFSFHAPVWQIWPLNFARLFWFWGLLSLIALAVWRPAGTRRILTIALPWAAISLIPYSFLTYSTRIPSRHLHLASVGIALLIGFALVTLFERYWPRRRAVAIAVCAVMVAHNVIYLWTKKRAQFQERAAPTQQLIALARTSNVPIYVKCFPRPPLVAESAVVLMAGDPAAHPLLWTPEQARAHPDAVIFCYQQR